jgi:branched-chain amino acid transport system permease protein
VMRIINFAHGAIYMIGSFVTWTVMAQMGQSFFIALPLTIAAACILALITERWMYRFIRLSHEAALTAFLGLSILLESILLLIYGGEEKGLSRVLPGELHLLGTTVSADRIMAVPFAILAVIGVFYLVYKTSIGRQMRAIAEDSELATLRGISANYINMIVFILGFSLAALSGALAAPLFPIYPAGATTILLKSFFVIMMGGLGSMGGAILAGLLLGLLDCVLGFIVGVPLAVISEFALLIILIMVRPRGLLGHGII